MCGRYTLTQPLPFIEEHFRLRGLPPHIAERYRPRYNVAPGQDVLAIVRADGPCQRSPQPGADGGAGAEPRVVPDERKATWLRWGLIPRWAKDKRISYKLINARGETVAEKPSFRQAFRQRRCLIPADGFYEWKPQGKQKQPFRFYPRSDKLFAFAGLWEVWEDPVHGQTIRSCTIITTEPNDLVSRVHDRMPVILEPEQYDDWLNAHSEPELLRSFLTSYPAEKMDVYPVSRAVNSPRNDEPSLLNPLPDGEESALPAQETEPSLQQSLWDPSPDET